MWTKHYSVEGKAYYYNAALNESKWQPPNNPQIVIHEAQNARPPSFSPSSMGRMESQSQAVDQHMNHSSVFQNQNFMQMEHSNLYLPTASSTASVIAQYDG